MEKKLTFAHFNFLQFILVCVCCNLLYSYSSKKECDKSKDESKRLSASGSNKYHEKNWICACCEMITSHVRKDDTAYIPLQSKCKTHADMNSYLQ